MKVSKAVNLFLDYHKPNSQKNTIRAYGSLLGKFRNHFPDRYLASISSEEVLSFLTSLNDTGKQLTKHTRYAYLKALFNFIRHNLDAQLRNPCDTPMLKKLFRLGKLVHWQVQEKESIDEIIFRTTKPRNRLMLELMARGGMRVGEVLKLTAVDVNDQKLTIQNPKRGKSAEVVFIPKKLADGLKDYLRAISCRKTGNRRQRPLRLPDHEGHFHESAARL